MEQPPITCSYYEKPASRVVKLFLELRGHTHDCSGAAAPVIPIRALQLA